MADDHLDDEPGPDRPNQLSPVPFVVALVGFLVFAVVAFVYLRPDNEGRLVRPDRLSVVDDDTVRAVAIGRPTCEVVERAQADLGEDAVFLELVVTEVGSCDEGTVDIVAEITLPQPVDDRRLVAGVGRLPLPCTTSDTGEGSTVTCTADR